MHNVELMLQAGFIHGDLSAYNVLYWQGEITIIDFPQVIHVQSNSRAQQILRRDVQRICQYFARYGIDADGRSIADGLWNLYQKTNAKNLLADLSRALDADNEDQKEE